VGGKAEGELNLSSPSTACFPSSPSPNLLSFFSKMNTTTASSSYDLCFVQTVSLLSMRRRRLEAGRPSTSSPSSPFSSHSSSASRRVFQPDFQLRIPHFGQHPPLSDVLKVQKDEVGGKASMYASVFDPSLPLFLPDPRDVSLDRAHVKRRRWTLLANLPRAEPLRIRFAPSVG